MEEKYTWYFRIIDKLFSARFLLTVGIAFTYGYVVISATNIYLHALMATPEKMEGFCTGLIVGFTSTAVMVIKSQYDRTDRKTEEKK